MMNVKSTYEFNPTALPATEPRRVEGSSHLLDWYLGRIGSMVDKQGLTSLHWVTGVNTVEVADRMLDVLTGGDLESVMVRDRSAVNGRSGEFHIIAAPDEAPAVEPLATLSGVRVSRLKDEYPDSFLIVNGTACLDLTPLRGDGGAPEYTDDLTVVDLYMGLFEVIVNAV